MSQDEAKTGSDVILITGDRFGTGDEELGGILMKAFLNTLWETEPKPSSILFINEGVRLSTEGSEVLDALALLEQAGVKLFSCGTCLEYYNLREKLAAGQVTNMKATVATLLAAGKVIKV
jgi:selenium metabolism protein YedF